MINITELAECCGCTACASICNHDAITMEEDGLGFFYPNIDETKCVECGLCDNICSFNDDYDKSLNFLEPKAYAARHKNMEEVMKSRSGAAFIAISDYVLDKLGGVIYGAGYKDHFRVVHKRAISKEERDEFRGSKYVQSDLGGVFREIKKDLKDGLTVLFSGTPCQTSGLNRYVGVKLRKNLILIDIVCHGVPSPYIWRDYLAYLENKQKDIITVVNFRDKGKYGWKAHKESFEFRGGKMTFTYTFYKHIMFRHSCGKCHFTNLHRPSDITLADFWGWEKTDPNINKDNKGVNLVLINTPKGLEIFNAVKNDLYTIPADLENIIQPNLQHPSAIHPDRMNFERDYIKRGFKYVMCKYGDLGWKWQLRYRLREIKQQIKKLLLKNRE